MASNVSATRRDGLSTFLLEMALDKARMKERLAAVLLEERKKRGHGDARRFPQPEMASLLGYSLRQYQRLEDPNEGSMPVWGDLYEILDKLGRPHTDIFGDEEPPPVEPPPDEPESGDPIKALSERFSTLERQMARIERLLESQASTGSEPGSTEEMPAS